MATAPSTPAAAGTIYFYFFRVSLTLIFLLSLSGAQQEVPATKRIDPQLIEEYCKNFTVGNQGSQEFYSPMYPREYPQDITCFRTITADIGYFVRIDFRDVFRIEPPSTVGKCEYDYLEIRDGDQGYSPLIGKTQKCLTVLNLISRNVEMFLFSTFRALRIWKFLLNRNT